MLDYLVKPELKDVDPDVNDLLAECGLTRTVQKIQWVDVYSKFAQINKVGISKYLQSLVVKKLSGGTAKIYTYDDNKTVMLAYAVNSSSRSDKLIHAIWTECALQDFDKVPPVPCLKRLQQVQKQGLFDRITVAEVEVFENEEVKPADPAFIGYRNGDETKYVITLWDGDIVLDDLI